MQVCTTLQTDNHASTPLLSSRYTLAYSLHERKQIHTYKFRQLPLTAANLSNCYDVDTPEQHAHTGAMRVALKLIPFK